jgi:hypothetical protein
MKYPRFGIRIALAFFGFSIPGLAMSSALLAQGSLPANSLPANAMPSNTLPALSPPLPPAYPTPAYPMGAYPMPAYYPASEPPVSMLMNGLLAEYQASQDEERKKQIVEKITQLVQKQFDQTHSMQQQEIKTLEALLAQKKKRIEKREAIKDKIVTDRVAALVQKAEGTGWESDGQPFPSGYALPAIPPAIPPAWTPVGNAPASFPPPQPANPIYSSPAGFSPATQPPAGLIPPSSPPVSLTPLGPVPFGQVPFGPVPFGQGGSGPTSGAQALFGAQTAGLPNPFQLPSQTVDEYPKARVSYEDFKELVAEVEPHRSARILSLDQFLQMSKQPNVMVLDTRSAFRYERIHIQGAKHLSFTDFTQTNLAGVIPTPETTVLIYCNNNFDGNQIDFASKSAPSRPSSNRSLGSQVASQEKPVQLALNVPTYINLYGYGYQNVYELGELVKVSDPRIQFEGTMVGKDK